MNDQQQDTALTPSDVCKINEFAISYDVTFPASNLENKVSYIAVIRIWWPYDEHNVRHSSYLSSDKFSASFLDSLSGNTLCSNSSAVISTKNQQHNM